MAMLQEEGEMWQTVGAAVLSVMTPPIHVRI